MTDVTLDRWVLAGAPASPLAADAKSLAAIRHLTQDAVYQLK